MPRTSAPTTRRRVGAVALPVVLALTLSSCVLGGDDEQKTMPSPSLSAKPVPDPSTTESRNAAPAKELQRFYAQRVRWKSCRGSMECATIRVPLDYGEPDGRTISLSLLRVPSPDPEHRVGSLVVNPGGPGASGVDFAANANGYFGPELLQAFDVVGFDPRGVGRSTPVECLSDSELDEFVAADPDPDSSEEWQRADDMLREFGDGCVERSGDVASHVSTAEAARDVDILRALLGDRRLTWFGASYGTFLGATYAELFPERVGRMVLDGALDPSLSNEQTSLVQARGFEVALRAYVGNCVDTGDCFLGRTVDEGTRRIREFLDDVEQQPISGGGDRQLEVGNAVVGIWAPLYNESYWPLLDQALRSAFEGDGSQLLSLSDQYTSRGPGGYVNNSFEALYAVNCLDHDDSMSSTDAAAKVEEFERASPTFGAIFAAGLASCEYWPVQSSREPAALTAEGAEPILVIGTTRDPATPLSWAKALAAQLDSGVLVIRDGDGHTGYNSGNQCVDDIVESYLVSGDVPKSGTTC